MIDINKAIESLDWSREPRGLYEPIGYTLSAGGKRVRPQLVLTACRMFGGEETEALPAALALEVFHNFTLLHDDVMDHAPVRRGRETVHIRWNENTAILSGDQMLIEAYKLVAKVPSDKLQSTLRWFNEMATEICEGQQLDVDFEEREDVQLEEYIEMIRLKTSVLLANALRTGAYLAVRPTKSSKPSTSMASTWDWPSRSRTTCWTSMAIPRPSARPSAATYAATRRPTCCSRRATVPTMPNVPVCRSCLLCRPDRIR